MRVLSIKLQLPFLILKKRKPLRYSDIVDNFTVTVRGETITIREYIDRNTTEELLATLMNYQRMIDTELFHLSKTNIPLPPRGGSEGFLGVVEVIANYFVKKRYSDYKQLLKYLLFTSAILIEAGDRLSEVDIVKNIVYQQLNYIHRAKNILPSTYHKLLDEINSLINSIYGEKGRILPPNNININMPL